MSRAVVLATRPAFESGSELSAGFVLSVRQTLERLSALGVRDIAVVDGRDAEQLRERLALHELPQISVTVIANQSWRNASGSALLLAKAWVDRPGSCLVVRGDRPLDVESLRALVQLGSVEKGDATIVVAMTAEVEPGADVRVKLTREADSEHYAVTSLGEDLVCADGVFTGHALVQRSIIPVLQSLPNPTLHSGLLQLARSGRVLAVTSVSWAWGARSRIDVEDNVTALLQAKRHATYTLLNPGPVNTTATVKSALVHPDVCHRDSIFSELMVSMTERLRRIFRGTPHHTVVPITGSGTAAMEAALVSTVPPDRKVLIIDNGAFGHRLVEVATVHEMNVLHLRYEWGEAVRVEDVERAFQEHSDIGVVAMIHHETSVGLLNPVREIGALCKKHDALLVVDAVSSLGAEDIDVVRDNIDICYSSANKCLHAVSGASFMCVAPRVWPRIELLSPRSYYLDLRRYRKYMDELAQTPFTPAVSVYFALDAACAEFLADGHAARFEMYRSRNRKLRDGLTALGMTSFTNTGLESSSIVTCRIPEDIVFQDLYDAVKARGIILYGCKGVLAERYMQIANMGHLSDSSIEEFLMVLREEIKRLSTHTRVSVPATAVAREKSASERRRVG
ncbi:MAG TPA: aminotransferase class V-fold PLP-dependent enzyme [Kofleriaceae bacterium]|nr:aminotransferase class V-fold PLP-dependent enzyme [Kofleriaceae bacterium]